MSRLGKVPIEVPSGVKVRVDGRHVEVQGPKGKLELDLMDGIAVEQEEGSVLVTRRDDSRAQRSAQGLMRSLVGNMIEGVSNGFSKTLEITGVGYRADVRGNEIHLSLGYSHPIVYQLPEGISASVDRQTTLTVSGIDRQLVGEVAAGIRKLRPPEPYKGKGIRYSDEQVRRKAGKAGAAK
ncbi:MAG: 50S ribosomal protein L6 [Deltaproteobacteria bacterium]|nr:MAG: 50S ribosomal protein L6 [Deltaproteobacteria bacterium]